MFGSTVLETALGLVFLYAGLALLAASVLVAVARLTSAVAAVAPVQRLTSGAARTSLLAVAAVLVIAFNADTLLVVRALSGAAPPRAVVAAERSPAQAVVPTATAAGDPDRSGVFVSYSHRDSAWLDTLRVALRPFERAEGFTTWDDRAIPPGSEWEPEILAAIARSRVAVLLVSPDFLASEFVHMVELPALLAQRADGLVVLWVPIRHSAYRETALEPLQAVINPATPIATLAAADQDRAFVHVAERVAAAAAGRQLPSSVAPDAGGGDGVPGAGLPLGWQNAYERLSWDGAAVALKLLGLALTALVVAALASVIHRRLDVTAGAGPWSR